MTENFFRFDWYIKPFQNWRYALNTIMDFVSIDLEDCCGQDFFLENGRWGQHTCPRIFESFSIHETFSITGWCVKIWCFPCVSTCGMAVVQISLEEMKKEFKIHESEFIQLFSIQRALSKMRLCVKIWSFSCLLTCDMAVVDILW